MRLKKILHKSSLLYKKKILVVGTFRSGTNLTKYCLKEFFKTEPVFNEWFWKHGVPPTEIQKPVPESVPIVVVSRNPIDLNKSLFRFWVAKRPDLYSGEPISEFIRRRIIVYDVSGGKIRPKYYFLSPTEYWNQFYFSWLNWKAVQNRVVFLQCEKLLSDPDTSLTIVGKKLHLKRRMEKEIILPNNRIGPTVDQAIDMPSDTLSPEDIAWINDQVDENIASALGYPVNDR